MVVFDTNLVSELRRPDRADARVSEWARAQPKHTCFISAVTLLELETGVLRLERRDPRQARSLRGWLNGTVLLHFDGRVLPVDAAVALRCASLHVPNPRPERDAYIAATCLIHGMTLATRNVADFRGTGVRLINPWSDPGAALQEGAAPFAG